MNRTDPQERIANRFRRLIADAHKAGLLVFVNAETVAIHLIPKEEAEGLDDLRDLGEPINVDDACGSRTAACSNGVYPAGFTQYANTEESLFGVEYTTSDRGEEDPDQ